MLALGMHVGVGAGLGLTCSPVGFSVCYEGDDTALDTVRIDCIACACGF